jgi:hypothetical protein
MKILSAVEWEFLNPACAADNEPISADKLANLLFYMHVNTCHR